MGMVVEHIGGHGPSSGTSTPASAREAGFREAQHVSAASLTQRYFAGTSILSAAPLDYPAVSGLDRPSHSRSHPDRGLIYHPQPSAIDLLPCDLGRHGAIWKPRRSERQLSAEQRRSLTPEVKSSPSCKAFSIELTNRLCAYCHSSIPTGERSVGFIQGDHTFNVAGICSRDQQSRQVLGIKGHLSNYTIGHGHNPVSMTSASGPNARYPSPDGSVAFPQPLRWDPQRSIELAGGVFPRDDCGKLHQRIVVVETAEPRKKVLADLASADRHAVRVLERDPLLLAIQRTDRVVDQCQDLLIGEA
jgi:hypothetical protein